ncbi:MAG: PhoH family protein [Myxococcota bacterium]|nr:PhoH family protein [Myxococcota bacterium]MDW8361519.1 PhoH family protein [Myxococcales bacterium]
MTRPTPLRVSRQAPTTDPQRTSSDVELLDPELMVRVTGAAGANLRVLERAMGVKAALRGATIRLAGAPHDVSLAERLLADLADLAARGAALTETEVARAAEHKRAHPDVRLAELQDEVVLVAASRKIITPRGLAQQRYVRAIETHDVVFGVGPAGTGKTYLAMAMAVRALAERRVKRILLARPAVEAGEKLGFLPGDLAEKVNPYLRPLYDALHDMMDIDRAKSMLDRGTIEVAPLAFMRGRTLNASFVILDEAQNTSVEQMKMFLTRLGLDSKAVITGDPTQVDLPPGQRSGLHDALDRLDGIEGVCICRFSDADVVRHPVVQRILRAYEPRDEASRAG